MEGGTGQVMSIFKAQYTKDEIKAREELIIKYIIALVHDTQLNPGITAYFLDYGIIDWSWPLRFVKGNHPYKGFKYYSQNAFDEVSRGKKKFRRDHIFPKNLLKKKLFKMKNPNPVEVRHLMETYGEICVITIEENAKLHNAGLNNDMPLGWKKGDDVFARYQRVDISVRVNDQQW